MKLKSLREGTIKERSKSFSSLYSMQMVTYFLSDPSSYALQARHLKKSASLKPRKTSSEN